MLMFTVQLQSVSWAQFHNQDLPSVLILIIADQMICCVLTNIKDVYVHAQLNYIFC